MRWMLTTAKKILSHNNDYSMDAVSSMNIENHAFFQIIPHAYYRLRLIVLLNG